jgi:hypothetical protein
VRARRAGARADVHREAQRAAFVDLAPAREVRLMPPA